MRFRNTYVSQSELTEAALRSKHPFQAAAVKEMVERGWEVFRIKEAYNVQVVLLSHKSWDCFGVLFPDGSFQRNLAGKKKVSWDWSRARTAAEATVAA